MSDDTSSTSGRSADSGSPGAGRPRPAYGEYATPEEQRARIQRPDLTYALETGQDPDRVAHPPNPAGSHAPAPAWVPLPPHVDAAAASRDGRRRVDVIVALVLLGYGLVQVVLTVIRALDYPSFARQFLDLAGISGEFTNLAEGETWGRIGAIAFVAGWLVTALVVFLRARRRRWVWWVPVVGAVVSTVLLTTCLVIPLMNDPVVVAFFLPNR
jgi:hypothetical protein